MRFYKWFVKSFRYKCFWEYGGWDVFEEIVWRGGVGVDYVDCLVGIEYMDLIDDLKEDRKYYVRERLRFVLIYEFGVICCEEVGGRFILCFD